MKKIFTLLGLALLGVSSASAEAYLSGSFNSWGNSDVFISNSVTISLAASTEYEFKVVDGDWLGNAGTMYWNNCTEWAFDSDANCKIRTLEAGDYVFTWSDGKLSVTYPTITSYTDIFIYTGVDEWTTPWVYLLKGLHWWDDNKGCGSNSEAHGIEMTSIGNGLYKASVPTAAIISTYIAFTNAEQNDWGEFWGTNVSYFDNFNSATPLLVVDKSINKSVNNCTYYNDGAWQQYPNYTRTGLTIGNYGTICLPFAATLEGATAYSIAGTTANGVALTEVGTSLVAGTPYIFKATAETLTATYSGTPAASQVGATGLVGTYGGTQLGNFGWSDQSKLYVLSNNVLRQFQGVGTANIGANKAYIYLEGVDPAPANSIVIPFADESTGIEGVSANAKTADMFNLQGQRVSNAQKGLFIVDGKKVIRK